MPPVLDPEKSKVDGLAFLGLSLSRNHERGHPDSVTNQTAFDLNDVLDRDYEFVSATNDDGWLVGGGEPGPPTSYKLAAKDSSHVEIMRIGTYEPKWGGVAKEEIIEVMKSGDIKIPQILALPTAVIANPDKPPELEIRFDMEKSVVVAFLADPENAPLPINWQLRFLHNQLFRRFVYPSRFCPGPFHSTILRKADFRSPKHKDLYFKKCAKAIAKWKESGPQPLHAPVEEETEENANRSGIYLFTDRDNIDQMFEPNFLPPYDTPDKRKIIAEALAEEWDEPTLSWKPYGAEAEAIDESKGALEQIMEKTPLGDAYKKNCVTC